MIDDHSESTHMKIYNTFVRKWGGAFIIIAALFPFTPLSLVVIALTLFHYPFRPFFTLRPGTAA